MSITAGTVESVPAVGAGVGDPYVAAQAAALFSHRVPCRTPLSPFVLLVRPSLFAASPAALGVGCSPYAFVGCVDRCGGHPGIGWVGGLLEFHSLFRVSDCMALWRSWLARRPVTAKVAGSSPVRVARVVGDVFPGARGIGQVAQLV